MQKTTIQKIRLGVFVILGTSLLVLALYFIGNRQNLFGTNMILYAEFTNVNGLQLGNNVRYSGINAGTVSGIEMAGQSEIVVKMTLQEKIGMKIKKNAVATIGSDGLVGSMIVNILPQGGDFLPIVSGDTIATYTKIGADDILTTLNMTNENAALLTSDLLKITTKIVQGKGTLGMLINDSILAQDLRSSIYQLKITSTGASKAVDELNEMISEINFKESIAGMLLHDSIAGVKMKNIVDNLEKTTEQINVMTINLDEYIHEIKEGEGVLNFVINNKEFVREIDSTMNNIKEASSRFNENMEAMKHNILFRGYFRKQEKQKKKKEKQL